MRFILTIRFTSRGLYPGSFVLYIYCMAKKQAAPLKKSIFTLSEDNRRKLKLAAAITERDMQDIVNEALQLWFKKNEKLFKL